MPIARTSLRVPRPIPRQHTASHVSMERGIRPIRHPGNMSMLDRVEMAVVDVRPQVVVVADEVFPVAPLPHAAFGCRHASLRAALSRRYRARESRLDVPPPHRDVQVVLWQGPDAM